MKRADVFFRVSVSEAYTVHGCAAKRDQEARGLIGFHFFESCPDCRKVFRGYELWGENGHKQATADNRAGLAWLLRHKAMRPWIMQDGRTMGYQFRKGGKIFIKGAWNV